MGRLIITIALAVFVSTGIYSDSILYTRENEELVYEFRTEADKICAISVDENRGYLIYRYGTTSELELEYPADREKSWELFRYEWAARPITNLAFTCDALIFTHDGTEYTVFHYDEFGIGKLTIGVRIVTPDGETIEIVGQNETIRGELGRIRTEAFPLEIADSSY